MITPDYVRTMAAYNAEMNRRFYAAAGRLPLEARCSDRGAFWGSLHGTLNHLLWGDRLWMSRLAGWPNPGVKQRDSHAMIGDFEALRTARFGADAEISAWADGVTHDWLAGDLRWFSGGAQREMEKPRALMVTHMFNHQTHHRGQAHALITAMGETTGDTDLGFIL